MSRTVPVGSPETAVTVATSLLEAARARQATRLTAELDVQTETAPYPAEQVPFYVQITRELGPRPRRPVPGKPKETEADHDAPRPVRSEHVLVQSGARTNRTVVLAGPASIVCPEAATT